MKIIDSMREALDGLTMDATTFSCVLDQVRLLANRDDATPAQARGLDSSQRIPDLSKTQIREILGLCPDIGKDSRMHCRKVKEAAIALVRGTRKFQEALGLCDEINETGADALAERCKALLAELRAEGEAGAETTIPKSPATSTLSAVVTGALKDSFTDAEVEDSGRSEGDEERSEVESMEEGEAE